MKTQLGIIGLLYSRKGSLCLILIAISSVALFMSKLSGLNYSAIVSTIAVIYNATHYLLDKQMSSSSQSIIPTDYNPYGIANKSNIQDSDIVTEATSVVLQRPPVTKNK